MMRKLKGESKSSLILRVYMREEAKCMRVVGVRHRLSGTQLHSFGKGESSGNVFVVHVLTVSGICFMESEWALLSPDKSLGNATEISTSRSTYSETQMLEVTAGFLTCSSDHGYIHFRSNIRQDSRCCWYCRTSITLRRLFC